MKKFIKNLSKNEKILISTFSPTKLGFQVSGKVEFNDYEISVISNKIIFLQTKNIECEKAVVRNLVDEGFSTFYFIGKGQSIDPNSTAKGYLITDHVNMSGKNPLRGVNDDNYGVRFPDMSETYSQLFSDAKLAQNDIIKAKLFVPKDISNLSGIEKNVIQKNMNLQVISNEIFSGVITAKHAGCKSCALILVNAFDINILFD